MGLLDDAIREHLDLKRRRGGDPAEIERLQREALGPVRRDPTGLRVAAETGSANDQPGSYPGDFGDDRGAAPLRADAVDDRRVEDDPFDDEPYEHDPFEDRATELHTAPEQIEEPHEQHPRRRGGLFGRMFGGHDQEPEAEHAPEPPRAPEPRRASEPRSAQPAPPQAEDEHYPISDDFYEDDPFAEDDPFLDDEPAGPRPSEPAPEPAAPQQPPAAPPPSLTFDAPPPRRPRFPDLPSQTPSGAPDDGQDYGDAAAEGPYEDQATEVHRAVEQQPPAAREPQAPRREEPDTESPELHAADTAEAPPGADWGDETQLFDVPGHFRAEDQSQAPEGEDVLEETPEFLQDTPDHDRLWFEQKPPRDFDFDG